MHFRTEVTPSFDKLQQILKKLPGLGYRSAERMALHLLLESPESAEELKKTLEVATSQIQACDICGNICEREEEGLDSCICEICSNNSRNASQICIVERVPDLFSLERANVFQGHYHILHGKLSPIHGVGPDELNMASLARRLQSEEVKEVILALSNDIEGEATCHYIQDELLKDSEVKISRIGFGLPSGGGLVYADSNTLKNALESRKDINKQNFC